jgi:hypothetical protein
MKRTKCLAGLFAVLLFIPAGAQAQVKSIGMKLGGACAACALAGQSYAVLSITSPLSGFVSCRK